MRMEYAFTPCDVPGIWAVTAQYVDENDPNAWLLTPCDFSSGLRFSFDKKKVFGFWQDYPYNLTEEQIQIFNKAFPSWAATKLWGKIPPELRRAYENDL